MKRRLAILAAALLAAAAPQTIAAARGETKPSVLVQLTKLRKGSLPRIVTAYGRVAIDPAARHSIVAPVAAAVAEIHVRPGQEVAKGAALIRLQPSAATAAAYSQAVSAVRVASELVKRTRTLRGQHLATGQQLADAEKSQSDARAALAALKAEGAGGPQTLKAPFRAIVTAVPASPGALVAQGARLIDLARPEGLVLRVGVEPGRATAIQPGDAARVTPLGARDAVAGEVLLRSQVVDPATGLVPVEITLPPGSFLMGETAEADIVTGKAHGFVVPHQAILVGDSGAPYVVQAVNMVARKVPVEIVASRGNQDVVAGALDPAAPLVLAGNHQLADGMRVRTAHAEDGRVSEK